MSTYVTQAAIVLPDEDPSENMVGELLDLGIGNSVTSSEASQRSLSPDLLTQRYVVFQLIKTIIYDVWINIQYFLM